VAARVLDVAQLSHVLNYELPSAPDVYVHRIDRTGTAREGTAITLVTARPGWRLRSVQREVREWEDYYDYIARTGRSAAKPPTSDCSPERELNVSPVS
jgi:superfamily II DNA/RNA helicase